MPTNFQKKGGFTLIEVMIAIIIVSVGLLGIASMQVMAIRTNSVASNMMTANVFAETMIDRLHSDPSNITSLAASATIDLNGWQTDVGNTLPSGLGSVVVTPVTTGSNRVSVTVSWKQGDSNLDPSIRNHSVNLTTIM